MLIAPVARVVDNTFNVNNNTNSEEELLDYEVRALKIHGKTIILPYGKMLTDLHIGRMRNYRTCWKRIVNFRFDE